MAECNPDGEAFGSADSAGQSPAMKKAGPSPAMRPKGWTKTSFCGANITFQAVIRSHFLDNRRLWYFP